LTFSIAIHEGTNTGIPVIGCLALFRQIWRKRALFNPAEISGNDLRNCSSGSLKIGGYSNSSPVVLQDVLTGNNFTITGGKIFNINSGTFVNQSPGAILGGGTVNINNATFFGVGAIVADVNNISSQINPGSAASTPGILNITGNYSQNSSGALNIEVGGTDAGTGFDQLNISGLATLAGGLNISLINGFVPTFGNQFQIITYGSYSSDFNSVTGLDLGGGLFFRRDVTPTEQTLVTCAEPVEVAGQIIAPVDGAAPDLPIDNALLELSLDGNVAYSVTTDSNGEYQVQTITPNLPGQKYTRRVTKDGVELDDKDVHYTPGVDVLDEVIKIKNYSAVASCPVDLHIYDVEGNHTGLSAEGEIELGIPNSWYRGDTEPEVIVILNPDAIYNIVVEGTGEGTFTLEVSNYITVDGEDVPATIDIQDVPVSLDDEISFTYDYTEIEEQVNALVDAGVPLDEAVQQTIESPVVMGITAPVSPVQVSTEIVTSAESY